MRKKKHLTERVELCKDKMLEMQCQNEHANDPLDESLFFNCERVFGNNNPVHLEIGCGKGAFALEIARRNPDINYIAIEKNMNVIVAGMEALEKTDLKNLYFCHGQAEYLTHLFKPDSVERIYLNFSCPFPKETYAKHRLSYIGFLEIYKQIMKKGSEIHLKTDNQRLFEFSIENFSEADFLLKNVSLDLHKSSFEGNIMTEYETRFTNLGLPIYRLEAVYRR